MDEIIYVDFQEHHYIVSEMTEEQKSDLRAYSQEMYDSLFGEVPEPVKNDIPPFAV
jgi:hypothetical protein